LLFIASQNSSQKLHRRFLAQYFAKGYKDNGSASTTPTDGTNNDNDNGNGNNISGVSPTAPTKIEAQPHQNGGLTYSHFSELDSLLTTQPLPGLVLQSEPKNTRGFYAGDIVARDGNKHVPSYYIALFGGLTAKLPTKNAGVKVPLYKPDEVTTSTTTSDSDAVNTGSPVTATTPESLEKSSGLFRMTRITLRTPPKVVGYAAHKKRPQELLDTMSLDTECTTELPWSQRNLVNPYRPGSFEYSAHQQVTVHNRVLGVGRYTVGNVVMGSKGLEAHSFTRMKQKEKDNNMKKKLKGYGGEGVDQEFRRSTSKMLSGIVGSVRKRDE